MSDFTAHHEEQAKIIAKLPISVPVDLQFDKLKKLTIRYSLVIAGIMIITFIISIYLLPTTYYMYSCLLQILIPLEALLGILLAFVIEALMERHACAGVLTLDSVGLTLSVAEKTQTLSWLAPLEIEQKFASIIEPALQLSLVANDKIQQEIIIYYEVWTISQGATQITLAHRTRQKAARQTQPLPALLAEVGHILPRSTRQVFEVIQVLGNCHFKSPLDDGARALFAWKSRLTPYGKKVRRRQLLALGLPLIVCVLGLGGLWFASEQYKKPRQSRPPVATSAPPPATTTPQIALDCQPRPNDPNAYLLTICEYLNAEQIDPGEEWDQFDIWDIREEEQQGQIFVIVTLTCCGTGDWALIDKESGEVLAYHFGVY